MQLRPRKKAATQNSENHSETEDEEVQKKPTATRGKAKAKPASEGRALAKKAAPQPVEPIEPAKPVRHVRHVRGKRGSLQHMLEVPLDILLEIFVHLEPNDLLNLARTNRDFRAFLMKKSSAPFWKAARRNVEGLPPCPEDLSEPAYANLLFQAHCHSCLKKNCQHIYWSLRVRLCKQCLVTSTYYIPYQGSLVSLWPITQDVAPLIPTLSKYAALSVLALVNCTRAYLPHVEVLRTVILSHKEDPGFIQAHIEQLQEQQTAIRKTFHELYVWHLNKTDSRTNELSNLRDSRQEQIIDKLKSMGWEDEFRMMGLRDQHTFNSLPEVRKAQLLTPRIWKNIEAKVVNFMENIKAARMAELRMNGQLERVKLVATIVEDTFSPEMLHSPSVADVVVHIPRVRETIDSLPYDAEMDAGFFDWLPNVLLEYAERRLQEAKQYFEDMIRSELQLDSSTKDPLSLAVAAWFSCDSCSADYTFPSVINHRCWHRLMTMAYGDDELIGITCRNFPGAVWKPQGFKKAVSHLSKLVQAYGLDPKTATIADMDSTPVRLICDNQSCYHSGRIGNHNNKEVRLIMDWRIAYSSGSYAKCSLTRVSEALAIAVKPLEEAARADVLKKWESHTYGFGCRHCRLVDNKSEILTHIREKHQITDPSEDDWYDAHTRPMFPDPVHLVSETIRDRAAWSVLDRIERGTAAYFKFDDMDEPPVATETKSPA